MTPTRDEPDYQSALGGARSQPPRADPVGLRARHLAQAIIDATHPVDFHGNGSSYRWKERIYHLCREHFEEADRTIEQLVKNAADIAKCRPTIVTLPGPWLGSVIGEERE